MPDAMLSAGAGLAGEAGDIVAIITSNFGVSLISKAAGIPGEHSEENYP